MERITITKKQWYKISNDYKFMKDGVPMCFLGCIQKDGGTVLVPVEIQN